MCRTNFYPWLRLKNKIEIKNLTIDKNGFFNFEEFNQFLDKNTKLVSLSHALYNTGSILPIENIGKILDEQIPFFVDSAQTVGCVDNVDQIWFSKVYLRSFKRDSEIMWV